MTLHLSLVGLIVGGVMQSELRETIHLPQTAGTWSWYKSLLVRPVQTAGLLRSLGYVMRPKRCHCENIFKP